MIGPELEEGVLYRMPRGASSTAFGFWWERWGGPALLRQPGFDPGPRAAGVCAAWLWVLTFVRMTGFLGRAVALHVVILDLIQDPERRAFALLGSGS